MENEIKSSELVKKREDIRTRIYVLMLEIIFIFGIPAVIAVIVGKKVDSYLNSSKTATLWFLVVSFVLSWIIVIIKYRKVSNELKKINGEIKSKE